jgi:hypothetical protein
MLPKNLRCDRCRLTPQPTTNTSCALCLHGLGSIVEYAIGVGAPSQQIPVAYPPPCRRCVVRMCRGMATWRQRLTPVTMFTMPLRACVGCTWMKTQVVLYDSWVFSMGMCARSTCTEHGMRVHACVRNRPLHSLVTKSINPGPLGSGLPLS